MGKKISALQVGTIIIFLITYIIYLFTGIVGDDVLVGVFVRNLGVFVVAVYLGYYICKNYKDLKGQISRFLILTILAIVLGGFSVLGEVNVIKDYKSGTKTLLLSQCHIEERSGIKGIMQWHYYLVGIDEQGNKHSLELNLKSKDALVGRTQVTIEYYENVNRIVRYN